MKWKNEREYQRYIESSFHDVFERELHDRAVWFEREKKIGDCRCDFYAKSTSGGFYVIEIKHVAHAWATKAAYNAIGQLLWYINAAFETGVICDVAVLMCNASPPKDTVKVIDRFNLPIEIVVVDN